MPVIEQIKQMQQQGLGTKEITRVLQDQGFSPKEISEAIEQSRVKAAVSTDDSSTEGMEQSVMQSPPQDITQINQPSPPMQRPQTQEMQQEQYPQYNEQNYSPDQQYPSQQYQDQRGNQDQGQGYGQEQNYGQDQGYNQDYYGTSDTGTITDIAEQIVSEKVEKIDKKISELNKFKAEIEGRTSNINERLRRIETIIDRLQATILGKIGEYGQNISDLKDEMITTQESFSKILNPLTDNIVELRKITGQETMKRVGSQIDKKRGKPKAKLRDDQNGFENYLR